MCDEAELSSVRNLGPASAKMLASAGLHDLDDLRELGPVLSFLAVRQCGHQPSLNLLWAIYGAIHDVGWNTLSESVKQSMLDEIDELTK